MTSSGQPDWALLFLLGLINLCIKHFVVVCCRFGRATNVRPLANIAGRTSVLGRWCHGRRFAALRTLTRHLANTQFDLLTYLFCLLYWTLYWALLLSAWYLSCDWMLFVLLLTFLVGLVYSYRTARSFSFYHYHLSPSCHDNLN